HRCIIFVHGFFGDSTTTWEHFYDLCDSRSVPGADVWAVSDVCFFDYGAEEDFVDASAEELGLFIEQVHPVPDAALFGLTPAELTLIRNPWKPYSHIILVGHSLGAVVIRACIERELKKTETGRIPNWISQCELRLFAAAHRGFQPLGWKGLCLILGPKR